MGNGVRGYKKSKTRNRFLSHRQCQGREYKDASAVVVAPSMAERSTFRGFSYSADCATVAPNLLPHTGVAKRNNMPPYDTLSTLSIAPTR